ncbi:penicillin-binding protein activator [Acetobacter pasteurianus]|uniref:penicillin-binding protein activator n=1 Tax=Acetobacter pasteurianus TaxID=438 RepID=UPI003D10B511
MTRACSLLSGLASQGLAGKQTWRKAGLAALGITGMALAGCADQSPSAGGGVSKPATSHKIGVLLPLSGPNAGLGHELLAGAQLAVGTNASTDPTGLQLDVHDTAAAGGASGAATAAVSAGDGLLLGPLTSGDTAVAAPAAQSAGIPVLAFTSDISQARSGVWIMGITPEDQVQRLVEQARQDGRRKFAALLPNNPLGHALGNGLQSACHDQGLAAPTIVYHSGTAASISQSLRNISNYDTRLQAAKGSSSEPAPYTPEATTADVDAAKTADKLPSNLAAALGTDGSSSAPTDTPKLEAPPFDALLLGDTGLNLRNVIVALNETQINLPSVRIMGPGLWAAFATKLGAIKGAWYAAPDPSSRQAFVTRFMAVNHHMPKPLADLSYDAANVAKTVAQSGVSGYPASALTRPDGFSGVNGPFTLLPDGRVRRALGVFEVIGGGSPAKMQSAPAKASAISG